MNHNPIILSLLSELETIIERAKFKWLDSDPIPKSLDLLDTLSVEILLVRQFAAEDSMVAVQAAWRDEVFGKVTFEKAFYGQEAIYIEAKALREKILKAIIDRISK